MTERAKMFGRKQDKQAVDEGQGVQVDDASQEAPDAPAAAVEGASAQERIAELERERDELKDRLLRAQAECANISKRLHQQHEQSLKHASMGLARSCLTVLDSLERTLDAAPPESAGDPLVRGVAMIRDEFVKLLGQHGVEPLESVGQPFDPTRHEAMLRDPSSNLPPNTVAAEFQRGYQMHGRVLRPAKVVVSAEAEPEPPAQAGGAAAEAGSALNDNQG